MTAARLYARFSTDRQSETSIEDQQRICRDHAQRHGWRVISEHSDQGISGAALGNRPAAREVIAQLQRGEILLVADLSRLARSQDLAPLITRLRFRGVRVVGAQDGFDSEARTARMQAGMSGIMSEEFRAMVGDRTHSALQRLAAQGKPTGGKALSDAPLLQEIFERFANGETMRAIAGDLNARGIPSPGAAWKRKERTKAGHWQVSALHAILRNELYAGRLVWNRSRWARDPDSGRRIRIERPQTEWIVREVPRVIDEVTWARVQARFRPQPGRGASPRYLLSGLLTCGVCGSKLVVVGGGQHRYKCSGHHAGGQAACSNALTVPRLLAEELLLQPVVEDLLSPAAVEAGVRALRETVPLPVARQNEELLALQRLVREGVLSEDVAAPAIVEARRKAQEMRDAQPLPFIARPTPEAWRATVADMREILQGDDVTAARVTLRALLGDIVCRPEGDFLVASLQAREIMLATGTGRWIGSGGVQRIYLPCRKGLAR